MILAAGAIIGLALLLWPFLISLSVAAVIAVLAHPAYGWGLARIGRPSLVALLMTLGIVAFVVLPSTGLLLAVLSSLESSLQATAAYVSSDAWAEASEKGRWAEEVRPYTHNRHHAMHEITVSAP